MAQSQHTTEQLLTLTVQAAAISSSKIVKFRGGAKSTLLVHLPTLENSSATLPMYEENASPNRLELLAAIRGLEEAYVLSINVKNPDIAAISPNSVSLEVGSIYVTTEIIPNLENWSAQGFQTAKDKPTANQDLIKYLHGLIEAMRRCGTNPVFNTLAEAPPIGNTGRLEYCAINPNVWAMSPLASQPVCCRGWMFRNLRFIRPRRMRGHTDEIANAPEYGLYAIGVGTVLLDVKLQNRSTTRLFIRHVLFVPRCEINVLPLAYQAFCTKKGADETARTQTVNTAAADSKMFDSSDGKLIDKSNGTSKGADIGFAPWIDGACILLQDGAGKNDVWPPGTPRNLTYQPLADVYWAGCNRRGNEKYRVIVDEVPDEEL